MLARFVTWWRNVADSLWALPLALASICAGLALVALNLDVPWASDIAWLYAGTAQQAPQFASSLVGAMITLTALAFSITMIVLTLAAQQLGPRLIAAFMRDRGTQAALGLFLGTIVYLLLVLRALDGDPSGGPPNLAITGGTALVLASVVTLLFFVHWLGHSVVADHVVARLGRALDRAIDRSFRAEPANTLGAAPANGEPVALETRGYVQLIDYESLAKSMCRLDAAIVLNIYPGQHVLHREIDARVIGASAKDARHAINSAIIVSAQRTAGQDPVWSVRQLVEIGLRALSPGINDEFTAVAVVDRLALSLSALISRHDPPRVWCDEAGIARVFGPTQTVEIVFDAAFEQLREASIDKAEVLRRFAINLAVLYAEAPHHNRAIVENHVSRMRDTIARAPLSDASKLTLTQTLNRRSTLQPLAHKRDRDS